MQASQPRSAETCELDSSPMRGELEGRVGGQNLLRKVGGLLGMGSLWPLQVGQFGKTKRKILQMSYLSRLKQ